MRNACLDFSQEHRNKEVLTVRKYWNLNKNARLIWVGIWNSTVISGKHLYFKIHDVEVLYGLYISLGTKVLHWLYISLGTRRRGVMTVRITPITEVNQN